MIRMDCCEGPNSQDLTRPSSFGAVELFLDPTDGRPRSVQIYEQVRNAIVEGRLTARDRLAPTRTVAAELGVSRSTVTDAYGRLSAEGYIEGRAGGGSVVGPGPLTPTRPR
jgi:GntR family transcriptional regulator/MocR family aminotransferase